MKFKAYGYGLVAATTLAASAWAAPLTINNQNVAEKAEWVEQPIATPPAYSSQHLLAIDMPRDLSVSIAVDPQTITVDADGVVRYVVVTRNQSGSENAFFEGIRCETHQVKSYARHGASGNWVMASEPVWKSFSDNMPSRHAAIFAKQGACKDGTAQTRDAIIDALKYGMRNNGNAGMPN